MMEKLFTALLDALKRRPDMILMIVIVFGFLYYMQSETKDRRLEFQRQEKVQEARDVRSNQLVNLRIDSSQDIQDRSIDAMNAVAGALIRQAENYATLRVEIAALILAVNDQRNSVDEVHTVLTGFSALIRQHVYNKNSAPALP